MDYIGAQLLGYDPERLPVVREAFGKFPWSLTSFTPDEVTLLGDMEKEGLAMKASEPIIYPVGWRDAAR
jgi:hypothetical protein